MGLIRRNIEAVMADLPEFCATRMPFDGSVILLKRGERGYWPAHGIVSPEIFNRERGITPAQVEAMIAGSMFGFDCPGADPLNNVLRVGQVEGHA